jgi:hypothetical protein
MATYDRDYWLHTLDRIARPVLSALARRRLKATMPVETYPPNRLDRRQFSHLEAIGRTLAGIAPWLELGPADTDEGKLRAELADLARKSIDAATDPASPDYMNFAVGRQPVVDAAFLSHAIVRAPTQLWANLQPRVQDNLVAALQSTRAIQPPMNNWLLFSAMVEAALCVAGRPWKTEPVDLAIKKLMDWYKGDGLYGDGPAFHWDYYNSFVIHPMLIDVVEAVSKQRKDWQSNRQPILARARRYAAIQERLISSDGTYPAIGRSLTYRCGAFHLLAQMALRRDLPAALSPGQVRCALTAVIRRTLEASGTFDDHGFLTIGLCGHQPGMAEEYISTGSLYLCTVGFLPLGLPPTDEFWTCGQTDWTSKRVWSGQDIGTDHAITD